MKNGPEMKWSSWKWCHSGELYRGFNRIEVGKISANDVKLTEKRCLFWNGSRVINVECHINFITCGRSKYIGNNIYIETIISQLGFILVLRIWTNTEDIILFYGYLRRRLNNTDTIFIIIYRMVEMVEMAAIGIVNPI